ncbi:hypothetical protein HYS54_01150, partial [Candidatus Micrarchaeota archaeon]|nr:hypothetical protein [Candidatus Micrarchaeota archaeon]
QAPQPPTGSKTTLEQGNKPLFITKRQPTATLTHADALILNNPTTTQTQSWRDTPTSGSKGTYTLTPTFNLNDNPNIDQITLTSYFEYSTNDKSILLEAYNHKLAKWTTSPYKATPFTGRYPTWRLCPEKHCELQANPAEYINPNNNSITFKITETDPYNNPTTRATIDYRSSTITLKTTTTKGTLIALTTPLNLQGTERVYVKVRDHTTGAFLEQTIWQKQQNNTPTPPLTPPTGGASYPFNGAPFNPTSGASDPNTGGNSRSGGAPPAIATSTSPDSPIPSGVPFNPAAAATATTLASAGAIFLALRNPQVTSKIFHHRVTAPHHALKQRERHGPRQLDPTNPRNRLPQPPPHNQPERPQRPPNRHDQAIPRTTTTKSVPKPSRH